MGIRSFRVAYPDAAARLLCPDLGESSTEKSSPPQLVVLASVSGLLLGALLGCLYVDTVVTPKVYFLE